MPVIPMPMPMPEPVRRTYLTNKWVQHEVCIVLLRRGMGMHITAQVIPLRGAMYLCLETARCNTICVMEAHPPKRTRPCFCLCVFVQNLTETVTTMSTCLLLTFNAAGGAAAEGALGDVIIIIIIIIIIIYIYIYIHVYRYIDRHMDISYGAQDMSEQAEG